MTDLDADGVFIGSIPALYDTYLVPLIFERYGCGHGESSTPRQRRMTSRTGRLYSARLSLA